MAAGLRRPDDRDGVLTHGSVSPTAHRQDGACPAPVTSASRSASLPTGPTNSVLDVAGVGLGHATSPRRAPPRTGRARLPAASPRTPTRARSSAGGAVLNGLGECTGFLTARSGMPRDAGLPDLDHAARPGLRRGLRARARADTPRSPTTSCIPVVGECDDSFLNDCRRMWVDRRRRRAAHDGGAGLTRRVGTAGRGRGRRRHRDVLPGLQGRHRHVVAGHARRAHGRGAADDQLRHARPADRGRRARRAAAARATPARRSRPARASAWSSPTRRSTRPAASGWPAGSGSGLARTGSVAHHGSGEIFLAASTTARTDRDGTVLDDGRAARRPRARRPLRGRRRRRRGVGAQLAAHGADHRRPRRQHVRGARPRHRRPPPARARP